MNELLTALIADAKARGLMGIVIWDQGGPRGIVAGCIDRDGNIAAQPRNWATHPNPESALRDLAERMDVTIAEKPVSDTDIQHALDFGRTVDQHLR